jgi:F0F1-type ATP synthase membrane subunit c/vacuolar-type H+-ATPase subunit K
MLTLLAVIVAALVIRFICGSAAQSPTERRELQGTKIISQRHWDLRVGALHRLR